MTKKEWLGWRETGDLKHNTLITLDEVKVRVYNEAALVFGAHDDESVERDTPRS